jgi:superfamily II DNA/RNA helicase
VQTCLLPFLLDQRYRRLYTPYDPAPDAAISAPTGSGKTLAYVIPIVEVNLHFAQPFEKTNVVSLDAVYKDIN